MSQLRQAQRLEAVGTLAGGIAHDFNNILGSILGYTQLIQMDIPEHGKEQHYIKQILEGCNRAKNLILQLLDFSRFNSRKHHKAAVSPAIIIKEAVKLLRATLPSSISIKTEISDPAGKIMAEPAQIQQVIMNLCTNSLKAMNNNQGTLTIKSEKVIFSPDSPSELPSPDLEYGPYMALSVIDDGHGIEPDIMDKIFNPYFSTHEKDQGSGLGLSVVHGIATECKGTVTVKSMPGKGAEFGLNACPVKESEILSRGTHAWDSALNTINVGKYNLGWASIGICTHAFYEAITHAARRRLYGKYVTDFPHIQELMTEAWARLYAMKLFALRNSDYMRTASRKDRRYLLYNPLTKMKVTTEGEKVINLIWDVIAAKGFEKDTCFEMAAIEIRGLPKLEGTVHVNMALIVKFIANYFFAPADMPDIPLTDAPDNDDFLFDQGKTRGLSTILFHDYNTACQSLDLPNIKMFREQIKLLKEMMVQAPFEKHQTKDIDFLLIIGELFALVVYGQLIIENTFILNIDRDITDQIFDFMVKDFSKHALQLYSKSSSTEKQMEFCTQMIKKPEINKNRFDKIWENKVYALQDTYEMNP
ncbi:MAG: ATP-binding protein [Thermodesulfobacteriota bacterium]|nr:ATP-binding protein [Thermodesulfobacteriota bacterium]